MRFSACPKCSASLLKLSALKQTQESAERGRRWYQFSRHVATCRACGVRLVLHPFVIRALTAYFVYWLTYVMAKHTIYDFLSVSSRTGHILIDLSFLGITALALLFVIIRYGYVLAEPDPTSNA